MKDVDRILMAAGIAGLTHLHSPPALAQTPNWNALTFQDLPALRTAGSFTAPEDLITLLGYDPSRRWQIGQAWADSTQLGDFQGSFELQRLTLAEIGAIANVDMTGLSLGDLELLNRLSLADLVEAIPRLSTVRIRALPPPLRDLLQSSGYRITDSANTTLGQLLTNQRISALPLNQLNLDTYSFTTLPGLTTTPLGNFRGWQQTPIGGVPGLTQVPFAQFPNAAVLQQATPSLVDIAFGPAEGDIKRSVSGSYQEGFAVPCLQTCPHIELGLPFEGGQWVSGLYQEVRGGYGVLGRLNGGLEPTGRHPFGSGFKVAVLETDEASGTATTGLYFRICARSTFVDLGCSPYFIGPVPWLPVQEEGITLL